MTGLAAVIAAIAASRGRPATVKVATAVTAAANVQPPLRSVDAGRTRTVRGGRSSHPFVSRSSGCHHGGRDGERGTRSRTSIAAGSGVEWLARLGTDISAAAPPCSRRPRPRAVVPATSKLIASLRSHRSGRCRGAAAGGKGRRLGGGAVRLLRWRQKQGRHLDAKEAVTGERQRRPWTGLSREGCRRQPRCHDITCGALLY